MRWEQESRGAVLPRDVAPSLGPPGAYRIEKHRAEAGRADREAGTGGARNVHGATAVPGGAWALCYTPVVQPLGVDLPNWAAPTRPGRWLSVRPPHRTPGTAILTGPRRAPPPVPRSTRRSRAGSGSGLWAGFGGPYRFPWRRRENPTPLSLPALRHCWTPCCGPSTTWVSVASERRWPRTARYIPDSAGARVTRSPGAMPAGLTLRRLPFGRPFALLLAVREGKKYQSLLLKIGNWQKGSHSHAEEFT